MKRQVAEIFSKSGIIKQFNASLYVKDEILFFTNSILDFLQEKTHIFTPHINAGN
jgi:hypothetical protein